MALSPYSGPRIRARFNTRIPARVNSGPGISQVIANGALTTGLDLESLDPVVSIPDPSLYRLFVYNEATETWETTTLDNLPTTTTGDTYTGRGDAIYTFLSTDRYVELTTALTAARIWTLPVASTYPAGTRIVVQDAIGGITSTNTLTITANAADTINGAATFVLNAAYAGVEMRSNGVNKWSARVINDGSVTAPKIPDGSLTNAKFANVANLTIKGRTAGGTGPVQDLTPLQAAAVIGAIVQTASAINSAYGSTVSTLPLDNTAPQRTTEATDLISLAFTPKSASSKLQIRGTVPVYVSSTGTAAACLFVDGVASAVAVAPQTIAAGYYDMIEVAIDVSPGSTATLTYVLAATGNVTVFVGGNGSGKIFGTSMFAQLTITEIQG